MNRRFLTSAVTIHAGACLIAIVSVGAGAPIANGLMDSSVELPMELPTPSMNDSSARVVEFLPDASAPALSLGLVESSAEFSEAESSSELAFELAVEPELIHESSLTADSLAEVLTGDRSDQQEAEAALPSESQPTLVRSAGR